MSAVSRAGLLAVCGSLLGLSTIIVGLRFFSRRKQRLPIKLDDVFAAVALVLYLVAVVCEIHLVHMKLLGYKYKELTEALSKGVAKVAIQYALAWDVFAADSAASIKLSALYFYRRLFSVPGSQKNAFNVMSQATIAIVVVWAVCFTIMPFFQCGTHLSALWDGTRARYCGNSKSYYLSLVISNFILDLWILMLPIPNVLRLHTSISKKLSILGVFLLAFAGLGASIARLVTYVDILLKGKAYAKHHDLGDAQTQAAYYSMLELGISLVAVNLPSLWLLFTSTVPEQALRSIRSVLSISSLRSSRSNNAAKDTTIIKKTELTTSHPSESKTALHCPRSQIFPGDLESFGTEVYVMDQLRSAKRI
ncbi:hypothetical protein K461DRAFT_174154 [Myriangium duriaei CBS 260.36]|uniref:Rhodopsin domain-containing protein n=1 Tax=Myriangium duriaei CBS 260.36 TaxID=1168546 RepID=A0A9P4MFU2_9PEZI|nr:hypothetical protein K461DRAFT_174154 [Myriangium duriaei CBS 260.36]